MLEDSSKLASGFLPHKRKEEKEDGKGNTLTVNLGFNWRNCVCLSASLAVWLLTSSRQGLLFLPLQTPRVHGLSFSSSLLSFHTLLFGCRDLLLRPRAHTSQVLGPWTLSSAPLKLFILREGLGELFKLALNLLCDPDCP